MSPSDIDLKLSGAAGPVDPVKPVVENWRDIAARSSVLAVPVSPRPNPQVGQRSVRRKFSIAERLRIVNEADACTEVGQIGALCRREGLYSSTLCGFRKQKAAGKLGGDPVKAREVRLEKDASRQRDSRKIAALEAENKKLKVLLELQKKVAELMDLSLEVPTAGEVLE